MKMNVGNFLYGSLIMLVKVGNCNVFILGKVLILVFFISNDL